MRVCVGGCTFVCACVRVCERTFAPALWLMQDRSFSDPITGVWQGKVCVSVCRCLRVCVMERIIWGLLLVSCILYHCGMLLSGCDLCYITHTYTDTHPQTHKVCLDGFVRTYIPLTASTPYCSPHHNTYNPEDIVWHFGQHTHSLPCQELEEKWWWWAKLSVMTWNKGDVQSDDETQWCQPTVLSPNSL